MTLDEILAGLNAGAKKRTSKPKGKSKPGAAGSADNSPLSNGLDFQSIMEISPVASVIYDGEQVVFFANEAFAKMLGLEHGTLEGKSLGELISTLDDEPSANPLGAGGGTQEREIQRLDGTTFWGIISTREMPVIDGKVPLHIAQIFDVTTQKNSFDDLAYRESIWRNAISASHIGVWDYNATNDSYFYSDHWRVMRGIPIGEEIDGKVSTWEARIHPEDLEDVRKHVKQQDSGELELSTFEYRERRTDGKWVWIQSRGRAVEWDEDGNAIRISGTDTDITSLKNEEERRTERASELHNKHVHALENAQRETEAAHRISNAKSLQDPLTELVNRRAFTDAIRKMINEDAEGKTIFSVMMVNLDGFKEINDVHGHIAGDRTICQIAKRLEQIVDEDDVVARLGGDEFGIILRATESGNPESRVKAIATKIIQDMEDPVTLGDHSIEIGASIGIASYPEHGNSTETLFRAADVAMHDVKIEGQGGSWEVFSPSLDIKMESNSNLEELTRTAVDSDEIQPYFQQIVDLGTGKIAGFEILARWHHPQRGFIAPDIFMPIIEQANLRIPFNVSMLRRACRAAQDWPENITLSFNMSADGIIDSEMPPRVFEILSEFNVTPARLEIEVTEAALAENADMGKEVVAALREGGVRVLLDDFGTGQAGVNYLRDFQFDGLKVDRSFISSMRRNEASEKIVRSMISLASGLNMYTIAEGIEDVDSHMYIQHTGGTYGQGYFYGKAVPAEQASAMLKEEEPAISATG